MTSIQNVTDDANQTFQLLLPNGESVQITLNYKPQQTGWFITVVYGDFEVDNFRVCTVYNILEQFSNLIPFGIGCFTQTGREPFFVEDFEQGFAQLTLLDQDDMTAIEDFYGQVGT